MASLLTGCTARYSHVLVGRIAKGQPGVLVQRDSGLDVGIGLTGIVPGLIALDEPTPSVELAQPPCETVLSEVDYRGNGFALILPPFQATASFPTIEVRSFCVAEPSTAP
jgi:hypothetical protein